MCYVEAPPVLEDTFVLPVRETVSATEINGSKIGAYLSKGNVHLFTSHPLEGVLIRIDFDEELKRPVIIFRPDRG